MWCSYCEQWVDPIEEQHPDDQYALIYWCPRCQEPVAEEEIEEEETS